MKISKFYADRNTPIRVKIEDPEDPENPAFFIGLSTISDKGLEIRDEQTRKMNARMTGSKKKSLDVSKALQSPKEAFSSKVDKVCDLVTGWENITGEDGSPLEFSREKLREILIRPEMEFLADIILDELERDDPNLHGSKVVS